MPKANGAVVIPIVTDHALYAPASSAMLNILRRFIMPAINDLRRSELNHAEAVHTVHHYALELQFMLAQIEDVEKQRK